MKFYKGIIFSLMIAAAFTISGCAHENKILPLRDDVQVYSLAYDKTYLIVVEALTGVPGWELEYTLKEDGIIQVRNINYSGIDKEDQRVIAFIVKRLARNQTSVEIDKRHQRIIGGKTLLKAVNKKISQRLKS